METSKIQPKHIFFLLPLQSLTFCVLYVFTELGSLELLLILMFLSFLMFFGVVLFSIGRLSFRR